MSNASWEWTEAGAQTLTLPSLCDGCPSPLQGEG
jgi:hypothetical protein